MARGMRLLFAGAPSYTMAVQHGSFGMSGQPVSMTYSAGSSGALFAAVGYDAQTPEHINFYLPALRAWAAGTRINVRYKLTSSGTWLTAHPLIPIDPAVSETGGPEAIVAAFGGSIFDLAPGANYNVELTVVEPGQADVVLTGTRATRSLPAAAGAATKNYPAMGGTLQAALDGLVPGDVLLIANGTYDINSLLLNVAGSAGSPIYIRGQSRAGTIIRDLNVEGYTGILTLRNASHVIVEDLTLQGNGVDSGISESFSTAVVQSAAGTTIRPTNITMRRVSALGVDRGFIAFLEVDGTLIYDCTLRGNNTWDKSWTDNPAAVLSYPNWTWNDDGVRLPGDGNCAFNNTLSGFGDCFANGGSPSEGLRCHATHFYRNKIEMTGDDTWEADYSSRNVSFYDNYVANCGTLFSADPVYGGPSWCFRNVCINAWRGPFKWNSYNSGMLVYGNTIIKCGNSWRGGAGDLWNQPNNGGASPAVNWSFRNNLGFKTGTGANTNILSFDANGSTNYDVTHNGWYSDGRFAWPNQLGTSQSFASLAAARSGLPSLPGFMASLPRHTGDIIVAPNVFDPPLTLTDYQTPHAAMALPTLRAGTSARNAGVAIPGITDGFSGAAPDMGALITGRSAVQYGDRNGGAPAWQGFTLPAAGAIGPISSNVLTDLTTDVNEEFSFYSTLGAWGSAALSLVKTGGAVTDILYTVGIGCGHNDQGNDGAYGWRGSTGALERVVNPSAACVARLFVSALTTDTTHGESIANRPDPQHCYQAMSALDSDENNGPAFVQLLGLAVGSNGGLVTGQPHILDLVGKSWARYAGVNATAAADPSPWPATIKDKTRSKFVLFPSNAGTGFYEIDYAAATPAWTTRTQSGRHSWPSGQACGVHHVALDLYLMGNMAGSGQTLQAISAAAPTGAWTDLTFSGSGPTTMNGSQLIYRPKDGCLYLPDMAAGHGANRLYKLTPPSSSPLSNPWTWSVITLTGTSHYRNKVAPWNDFGRFQLLDADGVDGLVVLADDVWPMEMWRFAD